MFLRVAVCYKHRAPDGAFTVQRRMNHSTRANEEVMPVKNKYPPRWNEARIRKVIEYYDSQTEEVEAAEIEAALASTTMEVPKALVPVVRALIAKHKSTRAREEESTRPRRVSAGKRLVATNKSRLA